MLDGSDFPKQGRKSVGVTRQYCGRLGKVANCQAGMFLAYVSPLGRALVDKRLYLPENWTSDRGRCDAAGVPEERRQYRSKTELALEIVKRALERGHLEAGWVAGDLEAGWVAGETPLVCRRPSVRAWRTWECDTSWTFRRASRCGRWILSGPVQPIRDGALLPSPSWWMGSGVPAAFQRRSMEEGGAQRRIG